MREKVETHGAIVEFAAIVTLNATNDRGELCLSVRKEIAKSVEDVGFEPEREGPQIVCEIVENNKVILVTGNTGNGRCPEITMY